MTVSPFAAWLISHYDWRTAMATIGVFAWILLIRLRCSCGRAPPVENSTTTAETVGSGPSLNRRSFHHNF